MGSIVLGIVIVGILSMSIGKVVSEKKKGVKCIGCSQGKSCAEKSKCQNEGITLKK